MDQTTGTCASCQWWHVMTSFSHQHVGFWGKKSVQFPLGECIQPSLAFFEAPATPQGACLLDEENDGGNMAVLCTGPAFGCVNWVRKTQDNVVEIPAEWQVIERPSHETPRT